MKLPIYNPFLSQITAIAAMLAAPLAHAANGTWLGNTGNWNAGGTWSGSTIADGADFTAFFTGVNITASPIITLGADRTIGNITFTDTTPSHDLTITGNTLTLARTDSVMPIINVTDSGRQMTIKSIIAGSNGLQKIGAGQLVLQDAINTFTGGLTIKAGTVACYTAGGTGGNFLSSGTVTIGDTANTGAAAELNFNGGNYTTTNAISVVGNGVSTISVTGYSKTLSSAITLSNNLKVVSANGGGSSLTFSGGVTGTGNLVIQSNAANGANTSTITFNTGALDMTGTITNSGTGSFTGAGNIDTTISAVIGTHVTGVIQNSANSKLILSGVNTFTGATTISAGKVKMNNSLALQYSAYDTTGSNGSTIGLDVTSGLSSGSLTLGGLAGGVNLATAFSGGFTGFVTKLILNPQTGISNTYSGVIANNVAMALTKTGAGTQILSGTNTYTGATIVSAGTLVAGADSAVSTNGAFGNAATAITLGDAATTTNNSSPSLLIGGAFNVARDVTIANQATTGTYTIGGNTAASSTFSGAIGLNKNLTVTADTGGTVNLTKSIANTTGTNTVTITGAGNVILNNASINQFAPTLFSVTSGTLSLGASSQIADTTNLTVAGGVFNTTTGSDWNETVAAFTISSGSITGTGTLTATTYGLSGGTVTANLGTGTMNVTGSTALNGTAGATTVNISAGTLTLGSASRFTGTTPALTLSGGQLTLAGAESVGAYTQSGGTLAGTGITLTGTSYALQGGTVNANLGTGNVTVTSGTTTLNGNSASTAVAINSGKLVVNGNVTTSSLTTVQTGATLGGTGTVGAATINGILAPGNSIGILNATGDVTWNANDAWVFELGGTAASTLALANTTSGLSDLLNITGVGSDFFKGTGSSFAFDFATGGAMGWYKLVDWTGTTNFVAGDFSATNLGSGLTGSFSVDSGTSALYLNVVPEPGAALIGSLGLLALLRRRRN